MFWEPWFETVGVVLLAVGGMLVGAALSRLRKPYQIAAYVFTFSLVAVLLVTRFVVPLRFVAPFYWLTAGRIKFLTLCVATTVGLTISLPQLPRRSERILICVLMGVVVGWFCVLPFLAPAVIRDELASVVTRIDADGVCIQTTNFTCGPAAAVTALRELGLDAQEGELAVLARTSPVVGTLPSSLYRALSRRYGPEGLECQWRYFGSSAQLKDAGVTLAVVRDAFLLDHCVAVLDVSDTMVTIADPSFGKLTVPLEQFEKVWRKYGIVLKRRRFADIEI